MRPRPENTSDDSGLLLVLYPPVPAPVPGVALPGPSVALSFLPSEEEEAALESLADSGAEVLEVRHAGDTLEAAALRARESYSDFNARWPGERPGGGQSFKERFTYRNTLSLWWLTTASMKQNEISNTFNYLCHLEVLLGWLGQRPFRHCQVITGDARFSSILRSACESRRIPFTGPEFGQESLFPLALRATLRRLGYLAWLAALAVLLRPLSWRRRPRRDRRRAGIGLLTTYPEILGCRNGRPWDRNLQALPEALEAAGVRTTLLASVSGRPLALLGRLRELWRLGRSSSPEVWPLQSQLGLSDLAVAWGQWQTLWRYLRLESRLRPLLKYRGIDVSSLVLRDLRASFLGNEIVHHLLVSRLVERWTRQTRPAGLLCSLELYAFARAGYFGVKRGSQATWTAAIQHANIGTMKLWYSYRPEELACNDHNYIEAMPVPDRYLFQGSGGFKVLTRSGYPAECGVVLGSPRYDGLARSLPELCREPDESREKPPWQVLVVPSLSRSDAQDLIDAVAQGCSPEASSGGRNDGYRVLVKPHPACPVDDLVAASRARWPTANMEVVAGDLYQLIRQSDVVVASYSTVGDEAIALGCPVICYTGLRPSMSTYLDVPAAPLVQSGQELRESLERMLNDPEYQQQYQQHWPRLVDWTFYHLDGDATRRIADYLSQLLSASPEPAQRQDEHYPMIKQGKGR